MGCSMKILINTKKSPLSLYLISISIELILYYLRMTRGNYNNNSNNDYKDIL